MLACRLSALPPELPPENSLIMSGDLAFHTRAMLRTLGVFFTRLAPADRVMVLRGLKGSVEGLEQRHALLVEREAEVAKRRTRRG